MGSPKAELLALLFNWKGIELAIWIEDVVLLEMEKFQF